MWRRCATLCFAAGTIGAFVADASPGLVVIKSPGVFLGVCDGKQVESDTAFRDCEELRVPKFSGPGCLAGAAPELLASLAEQSRLRYRAEQERIKYRSRMRSLRDTLSPVSTRDVSGLASPSEEMVALGLKAPK
jgi:hypothetical protein